MAVCSQTSRRVWERSDAALPELLALRPLDDDFLVQVAWADLGHQAGEVIVSRRMRGDDQSSFGDVHLDFIAFTYGDFLGKCFGNSKRQTVAPTLNDRLHVVCNEATPVFLSITAPSRTIPYLRTFALR